MKNYLKISFRLDDICSTMNWDNFNKVIEIFNTSSIKPLLGIIPDCKDPKLLYSEPLQDFYNIMRQYKQKGFSIAQHGYNHVYINKNGGILKINKQSEFAGLTYTEQLQKIKAGKAILVKHGLSTDIFMAPSHSYDLNTVKALKELGFNYITDGYTRKCYEYKGINFIPCRDVVSLRHKLKGIITICIHSNTMKADDFNCLKMFLSKYSHFCVDFNKLIEEKPDCIFWQLQQQIGLIRIKLYKFFVKADLIKYYHKLLNRS